MTVRFTGKVWFWKGPAPHHFVTVPDEQSRELKEIAKSVTYGWGMIPVNVTVGSTSFYTALWEKDGSYIVPLKLAVRKAENIAEGSEVDLVLDVIKSN